MIQHRTVSCVMQQVKIDDPSATKPDDWDDDIPRNIVDEVRNKLRNEVLVLYYKVPFEGIRT